MSTSTILEGIETLANVLVTMLSSNVILPFVGLLVAMYIFSIIFNLFRR